MSRRRLVGVAAVGTAAAAFRPAVAASASTPRTAALDYGLAETMLALGADPIAMPDTAGWAKWVVDPPLPSTVANLGSDQEVNLELLASLHPDLILTTPYLDDINPLLVRIAPCERLTLYAGDGPGPLVRAEAATRRIASMLGVSDRAEAYLARAAERFAADRVRLAGTRPGPLLLVDFLDPRHVRAYAARSLWQDALDRLGLGNAWWRPTTFWGFSTVGIEALAAVPDDTVLATFAPVPSDVLAVLGESAIWRSLPFVRRGRMLRLPTAFVFGAVPSALRFSRLLTDGLLTRRPA